MLINRNKDLYEIGSLTDSSKEKQNLELKKKQQSELEQLEFKRKQEATLLVLLTTVF